MAEGKYSLISVDAPEDDEEVIRVSAAGITRETPGTTSSDVVEAVHDAPRANPAAEPAIAEPEEQPGSPNQSAAEPVVEPEAQSQQLPEEGGDEPEEVPFANMQKAIIALLVLGLIAFAVYFALAH